MLCETMPNTLGNTNEQSLDVVGILLKMKKNGQALRHSNIYQYTNFSRIVGIELNCSSSSEPHNCSRTKLGLPNTNAIYLFYSSIDA